MADFNEEAFAELVDSYAASVERIRSEELYKWEATQCFQQHWDPDAEDFVAMLEASFSKAGNLLSGWNYLPRNMLLDFATVDLQGVKAALLELLDGAGDLASRMEVFSQAMDRQLAAKNQRIEADGGKPIQNTYQDARAMCVYLSFVHPERYYLYKSEMFLKFAKLVDFECAKGKYEKPVACHELLDALLAWVEENRPDVIERITYSCRTSCSSPPKPKGRKNRCKKRNLPKALIRSTALREMPYQRRGLQKALAKNSANAQSITIGCWSRIQRFGVLQKSQ